MNRRKLSAGLVVGAMALLGFGVTGGVANAAPPALPAPSIFTLPLPVPLAVTVTTGPGGAITDVSIDPADAAITVTKARPGKVSFTTDTDGVKVSIKSKGQTQSMSARAGSLDAFTANGGAGSWSGEVFPGVPGSVAYVVGGTPDAPTITVGAIVGGGVAGAPVTKVDDDGDEVSTKVVVTFTSGTLTRDLTIRLKVENESDDDDDDDSDDDSDSSASLRVTLGKIRGVPGSEAAGPKSWGAILCDGTPGTINYVLGADGTISDVTTNPADARIKTDEGKLEVRFATGERVKIRVSAEGAGFTISVKEKIRCRDAEDPTVNGQPADVSDDDDDDDDDDHDGDHHRGGDDDGGRHGGDDKKSDD
ncbi:MAG: hypothetical protein HY828_20310 [Actinobacteria bacterium]|nr:hypothetical protein [Actinomycetota bacterium]